MKTDSQIRQDVELELSFDPSVDERAVNVKVADGTLSLTGTVPHYSIKRAAEEAAKRVAGVRAIANDIEVKMPKAGERSDADIATAALNALKWHFELEYTDLQVVVQHGWVTLSGHVSFGHQKAEAESSVCKLLGVTGVTNHIVVRVASPKVERADIKKKIQSAFQRQAELDAKHIVVEIDNTEVSLEGTVHSLREIDDACRAAWAAPGVTAVRNKLQIRY
jgi:osmotically-inducible protein OsmY